MEDNFKIDQDFSEEIRELIAQKFNRNRALTASHRACFFADPYYLTPYEMAYLICIIEEKKAIHFMPEDYDSAEFYTLTGLSSCVIEKVVAAQKCTGNINSKGKEDRV